MQQYASFIFFWRNIRGFLRLKYFFLKVLFLPFPMSYSFIWQRAKKVVSDSLGLVDFAIGLVNSVFNLPKGK